MHHRFGRRRSLLLLGLSLGLLVVALIYINWGKMPVAFTSLAHNQNLGRPYNRYLVGIPDLLVIADPTDIDQLEAYLRLGAPPEQYPLPVLETLRRLDYDRHFALLILQGIAGGNSHVTVQQLTHQGRRVIVQADFVTPRPGQGQTGNVTDAYHLVALAKAGFLKQQVSIELWDGWQKRKEVVAYVDVLPHTPSPTPPPVASPVPRVAYPEPQALPLTAIPAYPVWRRTP